MAKLTSAKAASERFVAAALKGCRLSHSDSQHCEKQVSSDPNNIYLRGKLIGYYFVHVHCCEHACTKRLPHILWLIDRHPNIEWSSTAFISVDASDLESVYQAVREAWQRQADTYPNCAEVLGNMASFLCSWGDLEGAERLYIGARRLQPNEAVWREALKQVRQFRREGVEWTSLSREELRDGPHFYPFLCRHPKVEAINKMMDEINRSRRINQKTWKRFNRLVAQVVDVTHFNVSANEDDDSDQTLRSLCRQSLVTTLRSDQKSNPSLRQLTKPPLRNLWLALTTDSQTFNNQDMGPLNDLQ